MGAHLDVEGGPGTNPTNGGARPGAIPPYAGTLVRPRRKHDRSKYPWRAQRLRRKLIQITLVSSVALLFLCGVLYMMLTARPPSPESFDVQPRDVSAGA
jgi:hypothetical protein